MKLAIVTIGSRGDVEPYLHVGRALHERGHDVRLAAHEEFRTLVEGAGLAFHRMRGGIRELVATDAGKAWMGSANRPCHPQRPSVSTHDPEIV